MNLSKNKKVLMAAAGIFLVLVFVAGFIFVIFNINGKDSKNEVKKNGYPTAVKTVDVPETNGTGMAFFTSGDYFYRAHADGKGSLVYLNGVNMGLTEATTSLNNPDISYDTFTDWFTKIAEMNANTVKIFSVMNPDFYKAFYDYNKKNSDKPLYLIQGIWFSEDDMYNIGDAFGESGKIVESFSRAVKETIDIIHGNSDYTSYGETENAVYDNDISPYVAGYILGLEWPSDFVIETNKNNGDKKSFEGRYMHTQNATPFEAFLCQIGDTLISYETDNYKFQTPVAFLNWQSTDPLNHSNEPFDEEDAVSVDTQHIKTSETYYPGQFAAYDVYPYYPEFMNHQSEYISFKDDEGNKNPYLAYLKELKEYLDIPLLVAEYGVPTSRGIAHEGFMDFNQGGMTEEKQGEAIVSMMQSIAKSGCAGSMAFSWQDEWFKQTWNTVKYSPDDSSLRTPNRQSAEQSYGILAFEPGNKGACLVDGEFDEWADKTPVADAEGYNLYASFDEEYLYLYIENTTNEKFSEKKLFVPVSITGRGNSSWTENSVNFTSPVDFILSIDSKDNTRLLTDSYYDSFYYRYCVQKGIFQRFENLEKQNSGNFEKINQFISNEIYLPDDDKTIAPVKYEAGFMRFGNSDPESKSYDSLADFFYTDKGCEIRIPWALLNVLNPVEKVCIADFYAAGDITFEKFGDVSLGLFTESASSVSLQSINLNMTKSQYQSRLKKSYPILKEAMKDFMQ